MPDEGSTVGLLSGLMPDGDRGERRTPTRDEDFVAWLNSQAALLRRGSFDLVDAEAVAEELEDMAKRERRELENRLKRLLQHLLKWEFQADRRSRGWLATMDEQRDQIAKLLRDSPGLRGDVPWAIEENYPAAVRNASRDTGLSADAFPARCPYAPDDILSHAFQPGIPWAEPPARAPRRGRRR